MTLQKTIESIIQAPLTLPKLTTLSESESFKPLGIVTERDIVQCQSLGIDFEKVSAQEVMSFPLSTVKPQDSLWAVNQLMEKLRVRRLVVTESNGELAGIVTQTQMLQPTFRTLIIKSKLN